MALLFAPSDVPKLFGGRVSAGWVSEAQPTKWHSLVTSELRSADPPYQNWNDPSVGLIFAI